MTEVFNESLFTDLAKNFPTDVREFARRILVDEALLDDANDSAREKFFLNKLAKIGGHDDSKIDSKFLERVCTLLEAYDDAIEELEASRKE